MSAIGPDYLIDRINAVYDGRIDRFCFTPFDFDQHEFDAFRYIDRVLQKRVKMGHFVIEFGPGLDVVTLTKRAAP